MNLAYISEASRVLAAEYFVYRLNFILWRFRMVLNLLLIYFLWSAVYTDRGNLLGYSQSQMLTYVLIINVLSAVVLSGKIHEISSEILTGDIIYKLLRPVTYFTQVLLKEGVDKVINISFSFVEIGLLIVFLQPQLSFFITPSSIVFTLIFMMLGVFMAFFVGFCISMIAFWTPEVWAPRFIYFILVFFLAGNNFPLDILPSPLYEALMLTPFPYFMFVPAKILLFGTEFLQPQHYISAIFWTFGMYYIARAFWRKGMREFSFFGR